MVSRVYKSSNLDSPHELSKARRTFEAAHLHLHRHDDLMALANIVNSHIVTHVGLKGEPWSDVRSAVIVQVDLGEKVRVRLTDTHVHQRMLHVPCSMFYVLCSMFYGLCSMFYVYAR